MNLTRHGSWTLVVLACLVCSISTGCGLVSQLNYWIYGYKVDPKFKGMEDKKIAVVCVSGSSVMPGGDSALLANTVGTILGAQIKGAQIVPQAKVADWMDKNDWDQVDYDVIGRGVQADFVIGIDLESFSLREGQTLLKGKSDVRVRVLDMTKGGEAVYGPEEKHYEFPKNAAMHAVEGEANFRKKYVYLLAQEIAHDFYAYDTVEDFAVDSAVHSN